MSHSTHKHNSATVYGLWSSAAQRHLRRFRYRLYAPNGHRSSDGMACACHDSCCPGGLGGVLRRAAPLCDQHEGIVNLERFGSDEPLSVACTDRYATSASDRYQRIDKVITLRLGIVEL